MNPPRHIWILFAAVMIVALAAMIWLSSHTLGLDRMQRESAARVEWEERLRLALWRMDSWLAVWVGEENARPPAAYESFSPAPRAFTRENEKFGWGEVLVPSPLLTDTPSNTWVHFQFDARGIVTSPQVPPANRLRLVLESGLDESTLLAASNRLHQLRILLSEPSIPRKSSLAPFASLRKQLEETRDLESRLSDLKNSELVANSATEALGEAPSFSYGGQSPPIPPFPTVSNASQRAENDALARNAYLNQAILGGLSRQERSNPSLKGRSTAEPGSSMKRNISALEFPDSSEFTVGPMVPHWLGDQLVLCRRVNHSTGYRIQGAWLDLPSMQARLVESVRDLLPQATISPIREEPSSSDVLRLVALPLRLDPGPEMLLDVPSVSGIRATLILAWIAVLLALGALALLLRSILSLSERRAAFVSAVTHELRTPLTTFKLYSELLAGEMVTDPERRRGYFATLRAEADRLGHLVENVLAFARLEKNGGRHRVERISIGQLVCRVADRLRDRSEQAGFEFLTDVPQETVQVDADLGAVDQILFNLVDNACKYGHREGSLRRIHLEWIPPMARHARLRVRDHGPGIEGAVRVSLFQPFGKTADEAAQTAPGVGLGLALCRRLARSMGGDLALDESVSDGAAFILSIPEAKAGPTGPAASLDG